MIYQAGDFVEPSKGKLDYFYLNGVDLSQYVHCVHTYESICKEYLTAQVIIYDTNNLIENLGVTAGMNGQCQFQSPPNPTPYNWSLYVLKMRGEQVPDTLKYQIYYIDFIGAVYYKDRSQTVQTGHQFQTGTGAIQQIWGQYLTDSLSVITSSAGFIGTNSTPYNAANESPVTAIRSIMKKMVSSTSSSSGSWMLFRDRDNVKLAQLEQLIANKGSTTEYYIQKETWGSIFNDRDLYHAIIVAQAEAGRGDGGRSSGSEVAATVNQAQTVMDIATGRLLNNLGTVSSPFAGSLGNIVGGGKNNSGMQITDSSRWASGTAPFLKTLGERNYSAAVRNSPQMTLKVPLQTGLNATVGKGVQLSLCPPVGGVLSFNENLYPLNGAWLVTDIVHECYTDQRDAGGTTSMQLVLGP